mgnify:CR=1 FL=1
MTSIQIFFRKCWYKLTNKDNYKRFKYKEGIKKELEKSEYITIIISQDNYPEFYKKKDIEGYSSVIKHGQEGLLVTPKSDDKLAEAISMLLKDSNLRVSMGGHGRLRAQDFRWESVAKQVMEYYNVLYEEHANN